MTPTIREERPYEIYSISGAPRPWRVLLGLVAKGVPFELHTLEGSKKEHQTPEFRALNPRARTPVLKRGDWVLSESLAILAYLDEAYPSPPLFGTTPRERARIWQLVGEADHDLQDATNALTLPLFFKKLDDASDEVQAGAKATHRETALLEARLAEGDYLAGGRFSAVDCVAFPCVRIVARATERFPEVLGRLGLHPFTDVYPRVSRWLARIEALPGYERTFPRHWRAG
jgi:glutathione S-transferase